MDSLSNILKDVYNNNPSLKSFLRVIQYFSKSPNKLGIVWKEDSGWILPLEKAKLKIKPDMSDLAEYMRIGKNEIYKEEFQFIIIFADKPLTLLREARNMIEIFVKYLIQASNTERLISQQEQTIHHITKHVKAPLIGLFEKLEQSDSELRISDAKNEDLRKIPQSSILIGIGRPTQNDPRVNHVEKKSKENLDSALEIADNLADIIDMAKIDLGKTKIVEVEIQIKDLVDDVIGIIKEKHTKASIIVNFDDSVPVCLIGDDRRIKQILLNIWTNCIASLETDVRPKNKRRGLSVEVNAILIDPKSEGIVSSSVDSQYYLVSFQINDFRSKNFLRSVFANNLSMNLSTKLIDLLGGNLHFEEQPEGTSIIVELVLLVDKIYQVRYNTLRIAQLKKVILIADDCDPEKIEEIKTVLDDHKIKYTYASTTLEANILYPDILFDLYIAKHWNSTNTKHLPINQYRDKVQILDMLKY